MLSKTLWEDLSGGRKRFADGSAGTLGGISSLRSAGAARGTRWRPSGRPRTRWDGEAPGGCCCGAFALRPCAPGSLLAPASLPLRSIACVGETGVLWSSKSPAARRLLPRTGLTVSEWHIKFWQNPWDTSLSGACQTVLWPYKWIKGIKTSR